MPFFSLLQLLLRESTPPRQTRYNPPIASNCFRCSRHLRSSFSIFPVAATTGKCCYFQSAWNTAMHESNATCAVQRRSHPMINLRSDPNASVPGGNPQSSSFEEAAYTKTNPERAYGRAQSRGGDANTVLEVVSGFCCMECLCC